ncbi:MAG: S-layer homology domain-containing protein [Deltaproteobacteria bacterium]
MKTNKTLVLMALAAFLLTIISCAPAPRKEVSALDTPEHHVFSGNKLIDKGKYDDAKREFELALSLDPKYSPAHAGMGLVYGFQKNFDKGYDSLKDAKSYAKSKEDKVNSNVFMIRLLSMERKGKWLEKCEDEFNESVKLDPGASAAYYYMGKGYKVSYDFDKAGTMFKKVLDLNTRYVNEASEEWALVQKIQLAAPGSLIGKKIALIDEISRADIAALFIQELELEKLFKKRTPKRFDTSFQAPTQKFETETMVKAEAATDIKDHVLKTDIDTVMDLMVKGLEPYPDHTFQPDKKITRAEYAIMIEDILIKVSGDDKLATKFIGDNSPFPDLRSDLPYFNAVMVVTTRGIMKAKDMTTGEFGAMDTISGADSLLIIRKLKDELRFF